MLGEFCFATIRRAKIERGEIKRANIERTKNNIALDAWLSQASFSDDSFLNTSCCCAQ